MMPLKLEIGYSKMVLNRLRYLLINKEVFYETRFARNYWNDYRAIDLLGDNNWASSNNNVDDWTLR